MIILNAEQTLVAGLASLSEIYHRETGAALSTTSRTVVKDGSYLTKVLSGKQQISPRQYDKFATFMLDTLKGLPNWPVLAMSIEVVQPEIVPDGDDAALTGGSAAA